MNSGSPRDFERLRHYIAHLNVELHRKNEFIAMLCRDVNGHVHDCVVLKEKYDKAQAKARDGSEELADALGTLYLMEKEKNDLAAKVKALQEKLDKKEENFID